MCSCRHYHCSQNTMSSQNTMTDWAGHVWVYPRSNTCPLHLSANFGEQPSSGDLSGTASAGFLPPVSWYDEQIHFQDSISSSFLNLCKLSKLQSLNVYGVFYSKDGLQKGKTGMVLNLPFQSFLRGLSLFIVTKIRVVSTTSTVYLVN